MTGLLPLAEGEELVWQGTPDPLRSGAAYRLHAVLGLGLAGGVVGGLLGAAMPVALALAFLSIGLTFCALPWLMRRSASRTILAITTTRLIVLRARRDTPGLRWVGYANVAEVTCDPRPDGTGDLHIRHRDRAENHIETDLWESLFGLPDIRRVEAEIRSRLPR